MLIPSSRGRTRHGRFGPRPEETRPRNAPSRSARRSPMVTRPLRLLIVCLLLAPLAVPVAAGTPSDTVGMAKFIAYIISLDHAPGFQLAGRATAAYAIDRIRIYESAD